MTISINALYLIFSPILYEYPILEKFAGAMVALVTILVLPGMILLNWLHFPSGDGVFIYAASWLLTTSVYSLVWGGIAVRLFGKRL
ncbi:MAG: hypothetical protein AABM67_16180 [Acidobacteriota bacterium]